MDHDGGMSPVVSRLAGVALKAAFAAIMLVRRPRPIHPKGVMLDGSVRWLGGTRASGIRWIDEPPSAPVPVIARVSRSAGLPAPLPDIVGLALRIDGDAGPADLELASTGFGVPSRFWLAPQRSPSRARLGTLLPYRGDHGPVLLAARTISPDDLPTGLDELAEALEHMPWRLRLHWAMPLGHWHAFAELELQRSAGPVDRLLRFDAGRHQLPGARHYRWVDALRQPSYELAQKVEQGAGAARPASARADPAASRP